MATAEFAIVLPVVVLVLAMALAMLMAVTDQLRCVDAARVGARAAARGDTDAAVIQAARRAAPSGARISVSNGPRVTVTVTAPARALAGWLPAPLQVGAEAVAEREEAER